MQKFLFSLQLFLLYLIELMIRQEGKMMEFSKHVI